MSTIAHFLNLGKKWGIGATVGLLVLLPIGSRLARADGLGEHHTFFVDAEYDTTGRSSVPATLVATGPHSYIYIEDQILAQYGGTNALSNQINQARQAFDSTIYPADTAFWGSESNIDNDSHVTILFEQLKTGVGGYTDPANIFPSRPDQLSNQREMFTISGDALASNHANVFMAHEFQHLIAANQKTILHNVVEDTWLDELRAQYSITVAGYNSPFFNSDLAHRTQDFLQSPNDSMTEWQGTLVDYASVTLFGEYLVEHYGPGILQDTLHSQLVGIASINAWLSQHNYPERFGDIFSNWVMADYLNNTSPNNRFGYTNTDLAALHVLPTDSRQLSYPATSSFNFSIKPWQPKWYQFLMPWNLSAGQNIRVLWNAPLVSMIYVDNQGNVVPVANGDVIAPAAGASSFTLMPVDQSKTSGFGSSDAATSVVLNISFTSDSPAALRPTPAPFKIADGTLIMLPDKSGIYVVTGGYKRYLVAGVPALYGLDVSKVVMVSQQVYDSYRTANYVRAFGQKKVYAVWPDGTKHWLNISAAVFSSSGRDWNAIFTINDAEMNFYKTGADITN